MFAEIEETLCYLLVGTSDCASKNVEVNTAVEFYILEFRVARINYLCYIQS